MSDDLNASLPIYNCLPAGITALWPPLSKLPGSSARLLLLDSATRLASHMRSGKFFPHACNFTSQINFAPYACQGLVFCSTIFLRC